MVASSSESLRIHPVNRRTRRHIDGKSEVQPRSKKFNMSNYTATDGNATSGTRRPNFLTPEHWLRHYHDATANGHIPWSPATRGELLLADEHGILDMHPQWIPCRIGLRLLDLPRHFGRRLRPYSDYTAERIVVTLTSNPQMLKAVCTLISEGAE